MDRQVTNAIGSFLKIDGIDPERRQSLAVKSVRLSLTEADNDDRGCPLAHNDERCQKAGCTLLLPMSASILLTRHGLAGIERALMERLGVGQPPLGLVEKGQIVHT